MAGNILRRNIFGPRDQAPIAVVSASGGIVYNHLDALGSVIAASSNGAVASQIPHGVSDLRSRGRISSSSASSTGTSPAMKTHSLDVLAMRQNFNEADYLAANPDVAAAVAARQLPDGLTHLTRFGAAERRMLRDAGPIAALRQAKMTHMRPLLRTDIARRRHNGKYDYLSEASRTQTRVEATNAVSANPYDRLAEALIAESRTASSPMRRRTPPCDVRIFLNN